MAERERPAKSVTVHNIKQGPTNMRHDNRRRYSKDYSGEKQDLNTHTRSQSGERNTAEQMRNRRR